MMPRRVIHCHSEGEGWWRMRVDRLFPVREIDVFGWLTAGSFYALSTPAGLKTSLAAMPSLRLPSPRTISPYLSIDKPLSSRHLANIRARLATTNSEVQEPPDASVRSAAVLIPLCNVDGQPGILYEVRGQLRQHAGEVRSAMPWDAFG